MFIDKSVNYKIIPGVQIVGDDFLAGYIVEKLDAAGRVISQFFSQKTKAQLIEDIKNQNGFKTKSQVLMEEMIDAMEVD